MSKIVDGQDVDAAVTNPAFIFKQEDDQKSGKLDFIDTDSTNSGSVLINIQRNVNSLFSFLGAAANAIYNILPIWINSAGFSSTDSVFVRTDSLSSKFNGTTGHRHTGVDGDGPNLPPASIIGNQLQGKFQQQVNLTGVTGSSYDISTPFAGIGASTGQTVQGAVVSVPHNIVVLTQASGAFTNDFFEDAFGNIVYARITNSGVTWTLTFFSNVSGTETSYSFAIATDISYYVQFLYNPLTNIPVYSDLAFFPSQNLTADIVYATASIAGKILLASATPQPIAAAGSVGTSIKAALEDHIHSGVHSIAGPDATQVTGDPTFANGTNMNITRIGSAFTFNSTASSSPFIVGSIGSPQAVTTSSGIVLGAIPAGTTQIFAFVVGSPGAVAITLSQITASSGLTAGIILTILGTDNTKTVQISDGLVGPRTLQNGWSASYFYSGSNFIDIGGNT